MASQTGDPRVTAEMNELLGQELGRNQYGEPYFTWRWSEEMWWPSFPTGRFKSTETKVKIPIFGAPEETHDFEEIAPHEDAYSYSANCIHCLQPETDIAHNVYSIQVDSEPIYTRDRQVKKTDTWFIAKWLTPWEFILGPGRGATSLKHGEQAFFEKEPPQDAVLAAWQRQFPGADFPARGWRIPTDAYLPNSGDENWHRSPFGKTEPNRMDTMRFIEKVRYQTTRSLDAVVADMLQRQDETSYDTEKEIGEVCRDAFPAFLNPEPGKRNSFVSFPWSKKDKQ